MQTRRRVARAPRGEHARKQRPSTKANTREHKHAETRDRTGDLQIFGLTLSQLSYRGCNRPPGIPKQSPACGRKHASSKPNKPKQDHPKRRASTRSTCGLVAMTSAPHAEGRQFDPGQVYISLRPRCAAPPDPADAATAKETPKPDRGTPPGPPQKCKQATAPRDAARSTHWRKRQSRLWCPSLRADTCNGA